MEEYAPKQGSGALALKGAGGYAEDVPLSGAEVLSRLLGLHDENLQAIEARYPVSLSVHEGAVRVSGPDEEPVKIAAHLLRELSAVAAKGHEILAADVRRAMDALAEGRELRLDSLYSEVVCTTARGKPIRAKTAGQRAYIRAIRQNEILFAVGPAGTGKTYLAVCEAVSMLKEGRVSRVVLVRPAVEAGESLGYLPGDLREKVEPYVRPLYDAFYELLSPERFARYVEKGVIEIVPLAYMRGRTLNDSFIILDEAQNTTPPQMKMFLTRLGFGSKAVVTGDITQIDLPRGCPSGLRSVRAILQGIEGVGFFDLTDADVVRHEIVQKIVRAYERYEYLQGAAPRGARAELRDAGKGPE
ncbi:MAG: PhoH family protein [Fretibacterium sp.]|nr:PhoH family protein [Fretibacterium sp.]